PGFSRGRPYLDWRFPRQQGIQNGMPARLATHGRPQAAPAPEEYSLLGRRGPWKDALRRRMLAVADSVTMIAAFSAAGAVEGQHFILWAVVLLPLWLLLAKVEGL